MKFKALSSLAVSTAALALGFATLPLGAADTDDRIESAFASTYVYKTYLKDDAVKIDAKGGAVTLTGTVSEESHKALAQDTAASLPGVVSVSNKISTNAEAATENADKWIGRKVTLNLLFHRHVNSGKTDVAVKNGVVTLTGEATSVAQKELTGEYAKDIDGVKDVKNELRVANVPNVGAIAVSSESTTAGQQIDDASITAQVKTALASHRSTSAIKTKVQTLKGEVTLTGIAKNDAEKTLVTKLVTEIQGVVNVNNKMTVE